MEQEKQLTSLPENAYRELKPGEEYTPIMPASSSPREVTPYSVTMGIVMAVVFSAAAAFLGLKVGQVFEAAIPIAIIAVGMGNVLGKKNMLGQNVIIQSIGASSGVIVAGAIFTLPALYILGLDAAFWQVFLSSLFGGLLSLIVMEILLKAEGKFCSLFGVSVGGAAAHNIGQMAAAVIWLKNWAVIAYLPFLLVMSVPLGLVTGLTCSVVLHHLKKIDFGA